MNNKVSNRDSNIELLKCIAIFFIILFHSYNTLILKDGLGNYQLNIYEYLLIMMIQSLSHIGNTVFLVCSCWFLVGRKIIKYSKVFKLIINTFLISIMLMILFVILGYNIEKEYIISSFFPISKENNWYITCYIFFYCLVPYLNIIIDSLNKRHHLFISLILFILYYILEYFKFGDYYYTYLATFITVFFIVSYIKKYLILFINNSKPFVIMFLLSSSLLYMLYIYNYSIKELPIVLTVLDNPLFLIISISLFGIFRNINFDSNYFINELSSLSLYIYLIHENIIYRNFIRVKHLKFIMNNCFDNAVLNLVLFSIILFIISAFIAYLYKNTIEKTVTKITNIIGNKLDNFINN